QSPASLEYWIARSSRAMTAVDPRIAFKAGLTCYNIWNNVLTKPAQAGTREAAKGGHDMRSFRPTRRTFLKTGTAAAALIGVGPAIMRGASAQDADLAPYKAAKIDWQQAS